MKRSHPSPPDGPTDSDLAYTHAVEAINRIIRELDEILGVNPHEPMERVADQEAWRVR